MTAVEPESKYLPQMVVNLRERLQHGQHVTRILESQLDTAQQNISLLQGQVRLANETISNLKKHFRETENILTGLLAGDVVNGRSYQSNSSDEQKCRSPDAPCNASKNSTASVDSTTQSPQPGSNGDKLKSDEEKSESVKSPFAQQLRQVLDVLDEEPRKAVSMHQSESSTKVSSSCACSECLPSGQTKQFADIRGKGCGCGSSSCDAAHYQAGRHDEYRVVKRHQNSHAVSDHEPSVSFVSGRRTATNGSGSYANHCTGPCCSGESHHGYKLEKNTSIPLHYVDLQTSSIHRMGDSASKHEPGHRHLLGHCGEKCQCHAFVNYAPYGYHVVESSPGVPESIQPISPTARRKRSHLPVSPCEEPPHLKYTKVKRIDCSKLTAQKTLQDFTKRRYLPYNPRYDLDLLIVPPPIPAIDLLKGSSKPEVGSSVVPKYSAEVARALSPHVHSGGSPAILGSTLSAGKQSLPHAVINSIYGFKSPKTVLPPIKEERLDFKLPDPSSSVSMMEIAPSASNGSYHVGDEGPVVVSSCQEIPVAACL